MTTTRLYIETLEHLTPHAAAAVVVIEPNCSNRLERSSESIAGAAMFDTMLANAT